MFEWFCCGKHSLPRKSHIKLLNPIFSKNNIGLLYGIFTLLICFIKINHADTKWIGKGLLFIPMGIRHGKAFAQKLNG